VNALIITSRQEENLKGAPHNCCRRPPFDGEHLAPLLSDYLRQREGQSFSDSEVRGWRSGLRLAGEKGLTVHLARLYADEAVASKEKDGGDWPTTFPTCCSASWRGGPGQRESKTRGYGRVWRKTRGGLAWFCFQRRLAPVAVSEKQALDTLAPGRAARPSASQRLEMLEARLRLLAPSGGLGVRDRQLWFP